MSLYVTAFDGMGSGEDSGGGALQNLAGIETSDIMHIANDFLDQEGVQSTDDGDFACTADGTNLEIDVATGVAYVMNDAWSKATSVTKFWRVESDATEVVTLTAADGSLDRIDVIVLKINDAASADDEASNVATVDKVTGTAAASPTAPTVPDDAIKLAEVYVSAGVTTVSNADITDSRAKASLVAGSGAANNTGWITSSETWTYNSAAANTPVYTFYADGDVTAKYSPGMRIKLTQGGGTKYFIIVAVSAYDGGNDRTTITVYGGTDYTLTSGTITDQQYATVKAPQGFDLDPLKWQETHNASGSNDPADASWYNLGGNWYLPIGIWDVKVTFTNMQAEIPTSPGGDWLLVGATMSTANNTAGDTDLSLRHGTRMRSNTSEVRVYHSGTVSKFLNLSAEDQYFFNARLEVNGAAADTLAISVYATATCAFL